MARSLEPETIRAALEGILPYVQNPARYLGLERNLCRTAWGSVAVRVVLAFPDAYEIGMSHTGSQILYHLVNRRDDALAERCYAPLPDMAEALRHAGLPLYSLESYRPVAAFDLVGISLQTELGYTNIPYLLDLAGLSRFASERAEDDPIVLGGGPCTANPEPVADFFDAFLVGDAEIGLDPILDAVRDARAAGIDRLELLRRLAALDGVYVPRFYRWTPPARDDAAGGWETLDPAARLPVRRVWAPELDPADQPERPIVPFVEVIQDRLGVEVMRGCTQGCRFCQAGYWYRPVREHDPEATLERVERQVEETGFEQVGLLSLSTADYSQVGPLVATLARRLEGRRVSINLPSLRADAFSIGLAREVSRVRRSGFTFAPETGSDRLRRVVNKTFTNAEMVAAAEAAFASGWRMLKLYAMIGLPTETDDDLEELARLAEELVAAGRRAGGGGVEVKVSVGCFVPKASTPFQWEEFVPAEELWRRIERLRARLRRARGVRLSWGKPELAALEALLARGDRRLARTIASAHDHGAVFDGWGDHLDLDAWRQGLTETGVDLERELGSRELDQPLPWDVVDPGVRKAFLRAERRRAFNQTTTEDCRHGRCVRCGIPGDGEDLRLAHPTLEAPPTRTEVAPQPAPYRRYRVRFAKRGDARFLSHRQLMDALARALRAAGAPVRFTEGHNPHIKVSMGPALPLGFEGLAELFDVDCSAPLGRGHLEAISRRLPAGIELESAEALIEGAASIGKLAAVARYRMRPARGQEWPEGPERLPDELRGGVLFWTAEPDGELVLELNLRHEEGPTPTVKAILLGLGLDDAELPAVRVVRETLTLRPRRPRRARS